MSSTHPRVPDGQYAAAITSAVMFDRSPHGVVGIAGADRLSFLHGLLTNDIARLAPGSGTYAAYLTPQGRMISDMRVLETGSDTILVVERPVAEALARRLDSLVFSEDVQVSNASGELSELTVRGPRAAAVLEQAVGIPAARLTRFSEYDNVRPPGSPVTIVRDDDLGAAGFSLYVPVSDVRRFSSAILEAGALAGDDALREALRIEAGRPRFGVDMDADTIPLEAGIEDRAISMTKGCYVGQEVIVRVLHRGHGRVARRLVGIALAAAGVPSPNDAILAGEKEVGVVTSAAWSPRLNGPLALGYVQRDHIATGTKLLLNGASAQVVSLPLPPVDGASRG